MFRKKLREERLLYNFLDPYFEYKIDLSNFFVKASDNLPKWYKNLSVKKIEDMISEGFFVPNVRTCPSFVDLFKNSLLFISPSDVMIEYGKPGMKYIIPESNDVWFKLESHTWRDSDGKSFFRANKATNQMGQMWGDGMHNIKVVTPFEFSTKYKKMKVIYMSSIYYNQSSKLIVPPGVLDLLPNDPLGMSVNFFVDVSTFSATHTEKLLIKKGDPLAMLYFPDGLPKFDKTNKRQSFREKFYGNWMSRVKKYDDNQKSKKKCPFNF